MVHLFLQKLVFLLPTIGRNNHPQVWKEPQLTTPVTYFFLDGLLDEICIYGKARTGKEIKEDIAGFRKACQTDP